MPLYLKDITCNSCYDPAVDTVLNPAAWSDQAAGIFGAGAAYYNDFRGKRRPVESMSFPKRFPIKSFPILGERTTFSIRAGFFNVFNRLLSVSDPSTGSPSNPPTRNAQGLLTEGFGFMNYLAVSTSNQNNTCPANRSGQIVARLEF